MLPKRSRLTARELRALPRKGVIHISSPYFSARVVPTPGSGGKFAVVVSKKVARSAVARNTLRRRLYAALREVGMVSFPVRGVIYMKKEAVKAPFSVLREALEKGKETLAARTVHLKTSPNPK